MYTDLPLHVHIPDDFAGSHWRTAGTRKGPRFAATTFPCCATDNTPNIPVDTKTRSGAWSDHGGF